MVHLREDLKVDISVIATSRVSGSGRNSCGSTISSLTDRNKRLDLSNEVTRAVDFSSTPANTTFFASFWNQSKSCCCSVIANSHFKPPLLLSRLLGPGLRICSQVIPNLIVIPGQPTTRCNEFIHRQCWVTTSAFSISNKDLFCDLHCGRETIFVLHLNEVAEIVIHLIFVLSGLT